MPSHRQPRRSLSRAFVAAAVAVLLVASLGVAIGLGSPAGAASGNRVLILAETVSGGETSIEASEAIADGLSVDVVDGATWSGMTAAQFASYRAIILGDPTCSGLTSDAEAAAANAKTWGPTINGNIVILGTDPVFHASQGGETVTRRGVDFAVNQVGKTGAYITLSCYYHDTAPNTPVPLLDGIGAGGFTVTGVGCYNNAHIVAESPALSGLTDADISNWSCSVHEAFQTWSGGLIPLAIARDFDSSYTASDGSQGPPYILAGGDIRSFPLSLSPLSDSQPAGTAHIVTAQLLDGTTRAPVAGAKIGFKIVSGPNAGNSGICDPSTCHTNASGQVSFGYTSNGHPGTDTIQSFYDLNGNGTADVGEPQTSAGMTWTAPMNVYVALGDSYSAGEGTGDYYSGTDTSNNHCHRSPHAYGPLVDADRSLGTIDFVACSGAITADLIGPNTEGNIGAGTTRPEDAQLNALSKDTKYVTLTVGGNDLGFSSILSQCIFARVSTVKVYGSSGCASDPNLIKTVNDRLLALGGHGVAFSPNGNQIQSYASLLAKIQARAPHAKIYIGDYPRLFGSFGGECGIGTIHAHNVPVLGDVTAALKITSADATWLNSVAIRLWAVIVTAARQAHVTLADADATFDTHRLCDSSTSWIRPITGDYDKKTGVLSLDSGSVHPTITGQRKGYEAAFLQTSI